jgi:hypothetical protein
MQTGLFRYICGGPTPTPRPAGFAPGPPSAGLGSSLLVTGPAGYASLASHWIPIWPSSRLLAPGPIGWSWPFTAGHRARWLRAPLLVTGFLSLAPAVGCWPPEPIGGAGSSLVAPWPRGPCWPLDPIAGPGLIAGSRILIDGAGLPLVLDPHRSPGSRCWLVAEARGPYRLARGPRRRVSGSRCWVCSTGSVRIRCRSVRTLPVRCCSSGSVPLATRSTFGGVRAAPAYPLLIGPHPALSGRIFDHCRSVQTGAVRASPVSGAAQSTHPCRCFVPLGHCRLAHIR